MLVALPSLLLWPLLKFDNEEDLIAPDFDRNYKTIKIKH